MYSDCIRCRKSLGRNHEINHLPVGQRVAFDVTRGRLWVVCPGCGQWNLVPLEERWEALAECEAIAARSEARGGTTDVGLARTEDGLELLRVGGLSDADIANWRYGRGLARRQSILRLLALALGVLALALGIRAGFESHSAGIGVYTSLVAAFWLAFIWQDPPHLLPTGIPVAGQRRLLWPWDRNGIQVRGLDGEERPAVIIPNGDNPIHLTGRDAAEFLAAWLPRINGASCAEASVRRAVARVDQAERGVKRDIAAEPKRPTRRQRSSALSTPRDLAAWELLLTSRSPRMLTDLAPEHRLALEMAVTEYVEQAEIMAVASASGTALTEQQAIAAIADELIVDPSVTAKLQAIRARIQAQSEDGSARDHFKAPPTVTPDSSHKRSNER